MKEVIKIEENYTRISNEYIKGDKALTCDELALLTIISMNKTIKNQCIFTIDYILDLFKITTNTTRKIKDIKQILNTLHEDDILYYYKSTIETKSNVLNIDSVDKSKFIFATDNIITDNDYTIIYDTEIYKILDYSNKHKIDTNTLLTLFIYICSFINNNKQDENYKLCYVSHENLCSNLDIAENTVIKYIEILNKLNLLRCDYAGYKETAKGKIKNDVMYYCRYENENLLINRLNKIRNEKGLIKLNNRSKQKSNIKRSIKQIINTLEKKKDKNTINNIENIKLELLKIEYSKMDKKEEKEEI